MRILHTSDWHLGKVMNGHSRLAEQEEFFIELNEIADTKNVDLIIVAGDVYDVFTPPAAAERLFYRSVSQLAQKRPVLIIAGNHDNPERLTASSPLAVEQGVILLGTPSSAAEVGEFNGYRVVSAGAGFLELEIGSERAVIITMAYPSEKRLNEVFSDELAEAAFQKNYSRRIGELFDGLSSRFRDDTVNLVTGHFYIAGGEDSGSERDIQLGGIYAVGADELPKNAQYIAMGHLHRPQSVKCGIPCYYSGSPIQYSKSEITSAKSVNIVEVVPGAEAVVEKVYLRNYKPLEIWRMKSIEQAIEKCAERSGDNCYVFLEIETSRAILSSENHELHRLKADIVEINLVMEQEQGTEQEADYEASVSDEFRKFYQGSRNAEPSEELVGLFMSLLSESEERQ